MVQMMDFYPTDPALISTVTCMDNRWHRKGCWFKSADSTQHYRNCRCVKQLL